MSKANLDTVAETVKTELRTRSLYVLVLVVVILGDDTKSDWRIRVTINQKIFYEKTKEEKARKREAIKMARERVRSKELRVLMKTKERVRRKELRELRKTK
jgi:alkanesulfonate monooxygenase SsuD/methylene tetrahydromethanopterin reductase-like flavin-dependent oxidoreductase (luciferase family)